MTSTESKKYKYLYISIDDIRTTYGHQEHIIWNSFNKCTKIIVQVKYQKVNDDDLYYQSPS